MKPLLRYSLETGVLEYLAIVFECLIWYLFGTPTWKITGKEMQRNLFPYLGYLETWRILWRSCLLPISSVVEPPWLFNVWTMDFQIFGKRQYSNYFFKSRSKQYGSIVNLTKCTIVFQNCLCTFLIINKCIKCIHSSDESTCAHGLIQLEYKLIKESQNLKKHITLKVSKWFALIQSDIFTLSF